MRACTATSNSHSSSGQLFGAGINASFSCLVVDCEANRNDGAGIIITEASEVRDCKSHFNGQGGVGAGIYALNTGSVVEPDSGWNKLIGNDLTFNVTGVDVDTRANFIVQNTSRGNGENFNIVTLNNVGVIVLPGNSPAISGSGAGQALGVNTTNPWANFSW